MYLDTDKILSLIAWCTFLLSLWRYLATCFASSVFPTRKINQASKFKVESWWTVVKWAIFEVLNNAFGIVTTAWVLDTYRFRRNQEIETQGDALHHTSHFLSCVLLKEIIFLENEISSYQERVAYIGVPQISS